MYEDDDYEDYDDEGSPWVRRGAILAVLAVVAGAIVWFGARSGGGDDEQLATATNGDLTTEPNATEPDTTEPDTTEPDAAEPDATVSTTATTTTTTTTTVEEVTFPTLPDGNPVPVLAIFDGELITLSGTVPTEAAAERLRVLALANSTDPNAEVASFLSIDPAVPVGVGVRVIEMNSARFPEGSPEISQEHAQQLNRVAAIMTALPNITVDVVGHADQRGDEETNFRLSTERARAAADYLAFQGVDPARMSARGAGESDLLTLNSDDTALALNRRTEFVFSGLLVPDPVEPESE